jgi:hypothetical protein
METTLHRQLKASFGPERGGQSEVFAEGFRADALSADGEWIEIQSGALGPLRPKLRRLLPSRRIRVVKPVVVERRIIRRARRNGRDLSARLSPRRGVLVDIFDDLIGLARVFPHANLRVDVLSVAIDEVRVPRKRWPGYTVIDRRLRDIRSAVILEHPGDLWSLLPAGIPSPFTTLDLAAHLDRPVFFAQRVAYCLRHAGAAIQTGKIGNRVIYTRPDEASALAVSRRPEAIYERA